MARLSRSSLTKLGSLAGAVIRRSSSYNLSPWAIQPLHIQERYSHNETKDSVKKGVNQAMRSGENLKNQACSKREEIFEESKDKAQGVAERAKQVAQEAWGTAKGTAEKVGDSVIGKAEQSQGGIKDAAEIAKRSMNTKKDLE